MRLRSLLLPCLLVPAAALTAPADAAVVGFTQTASASYQLTDDLFEGTPGAREEEVRTTRRTGRLGAGFGTSNSSAVLSAGAGGSVTAGVDTVVLHVSGDAAYQQFEGSALTSARANHAIEFELDAPAWYSLTAAGTFTDTFGGASGFSVTLEDAADASTLDSLSASGSDGRDGNGAIESRVGRFVGLLQPGRYVFRGGSGVSGGPVSQEISASLQGTLTLNASLVPEPAALVTLTLAAPVLLRRRRPAA